MIYFTPEVTYNCVCAIMLLCIFFFSLRVTLTAGRIFCDALVRIYFRMVGQKQ